ncbi:MAG: CRISPR-associated protein Cas4 [Bacillota bacterium]
MKLKVSDIKQFIYCPRVVFYQYVLPVDRKVTRKMEYGKLEHMELDRLEKRRKLKRYGLVDGERVFHTHLFSPRLNLEGKLDMHIRIGEKILPVEFKDTGRRVSLNHKYQLAAYALLLEDAYNTTIHHGFVYLHQRNEIVPVEITPGVRNYVMGIMNKIRRMARLELDPGPTRRRGKCVDCEYRNFCGDVR